MFGSLQQKLSFPDTTMSLFRDFCADFGPKRLVTLAARLGYSRNRGLPRIFG